MEKIGKYQILEKLGQGGMGVVYKALDTLIERVVAVKTVISNLDADPELRARFFREGRSAGQLSHKNIVTIFDLGEENGMAYIAMEYLEGEDLRAKILKGEKMDLPQLVFLMKEVCEGLAHAHERNVIHRDIKPANIFITRTGQVKILDFGLARTTASDLTTSGHALGTPNYMSPEQVRGEKVDYRTDIFSVGVLFYELLTYRKAFQGDSFTSTIFRILQNDPDPIEQFNPDVPKELRDIVYKALTKDRDLRYQTLGLMLEDLCRHFGYTQAGPVDLSATAGISSAGKEGGSGSGPIAARGGVGVPRGNTPAPGGARVGSGASSGKRRQQSGPRAAQSLTPPPQVSSMSEEATQVDTVPKLPPQKKSKPGVLVACVAVLSLVLVSWMFLHGRGAKAGRNTAAVSAVNPPVAKVEQSPPPTIPAPDSATKPPSGDQELATQLARATEALKSRKFAEAAGNARGILSRHPDDAEAQSILQASQESLDRVGGMKEKAKSYLAAGDYQRASSSLQEALGIAPSDEEALRLVGQLNQTMRKNASQAFTRLRDARSRAEEARAPSLSTRSFGTAQTAEAEANRLQGQGNFAGSALKAAEAANLFAIAEKEAVDEAAAAAERTRTAEREKLKAAQRLKSDTSRQGYDRERDLAVQAGAQEKAREPFAAAEKIAGGARAKADSGDFEGAAREFEEAGAAMRNAHTVAAEAMRRELAKPAEPPKAPPPPATAAPPPPTSHETLESIQKAIYGLPDQYKAAMEGKDFGLLKSIWPALTPQQEQSFRNQWSYTRSLRIIPNQSRIERLEAGSAILSVQFHNEQEINNGTRRRWDQKATFSLSRRGQSWVIESATFEAVH